MPYSQSTAHTLHSFCVQDRSCSEKVGHTYGHARNSVSCMVSKHCKINVETVCFCTCPVVRTRSCRNTILGSRIVEMGPYCSYVSVVLGSRNFAARASCDKHDLEVGTLSSCSYLKNATGYEAQTCVR